MSELPAPTPTPMTEEEAKELNLFALSPIGAEGDLEDSDEDEANQPLKPTIDTQPKEFLERDVAYECGRRDPSDVVLSGPIIGGWGPGRYHMNRWQALQFLNKKFGPDRVRRLQGETKGRWAFLVKGLKSLEGLRK